MKKLKMKKLAVTVVAVFVYVFLSDWLIHGGILGKIYGETAHLWRPESEMERYMGFMILGQLLISLFFSIIFAKGYENKGIQEGVRFGALIGLLLVSPNFIMYAVTPYPATLLWAWVFLGILQTMGAGVVAALAYKGK